MKKGAGAIARRLAGRGVGFRVTTPFETLSECCIGCGACAQVCPTQCIKVEDRGTERKIYISTQVLARFELVKCDICGVPFAPQKYLDYVRELRQEHPKVKESGKICPACERKHKVRERTRLLKMTR